ncbi:hypothetical protein JJB09_25585 [Rhizobium sp. KVB221]|uniref:Uncharacterized protein n=1 Tax=Rhizobium setariae TaxID=2801340 RepID=A0A936YRH2_9HYPH|nr:hypothetical protein [Rhizobium setariae]MBL0375388.1 hypothetical protein [Rhizobium setariae]
MAKPINFIHRGTEYIATVENQFHFNGRPMDEYLIRADRVKVEHYYEVENYILVPRRLNRAQREAVIIKKMSGSEPAYNVKAGVT